MSVTIGRCYYFPIENLVDAVDAVREIARLDSDNMLPLTLPDGRVVEGPFWDEDFEQETKTWSRHPEKLRGPGDGASGETTIRAMIDGTIREFFDADLGLRRTKDRHGNRFIYLPINVSLSLGVRFAEIMFASECQEIGQMIALSESVHAVLDSVDSQADGVLVLEYGNGSLACEAPGGGIISNNGNGEEMNPDEVVAFFSERLNPNVT